MFNEDIPYLKVQKHGKVRCFKLTGGWVSRIMHQMFWFGKYFKRWLVVDGIEYPVSTYNELANMLEEIDHPLY